MKNRTVRCRLVFLLLAGLFVILAALSFSVGSVSLSLRDMCEILSGADRESTAFHILWDIRLPRLLAAALLGGALSVSGFLLQTFFANPIAGPFVLGISSGAKLVVAFVMILFLGKGLFMGSASMIVAAFAGSMPFHRSRPQDFLFSDMPLPVSPFPFSFSLLLISGFCPGS